MKILSFVISSPTEDATYYSAIYGCSTVYVLNTTGGAAETTGSVDAIFAAGGWDLGNRRGAEVVQLGAGGEVLDCPDLPDLPRADKGLIALADGGGRPVVCGGAENPSPTSCLVLDGGAWAGAPFAMGVRHRYGASVRLGDGRYWVLGDVYG